MATAESEKLLHAEQPGTEVNEFIQRDFPEVGLEAPRSVLVLAASLVGAWASAAGLIWFVSPGSAAFLIVIGTVLLVAYVPLRIAVMFLVVLAPFDLHRQVGSQWLYLDLLAAAIAIPLLRGRRWPPVLSWLLVPFSLYFLLSGGVRSLLPAWFWGYAVRWLIALCFSAAVALSDSIEEIAIAAGVTLIPLSAYGMYQLFAGDFGGVYTWMNPHMLDQPWLSRSYSFLWHPNAFGNFAGMASVMMIALGARGYRSKLSFFLGACGLVGLLGSGSRGAEIGVALAILVVLTQTPRFWRKLAVIVIVAAIIAAALHYEVIPLQRAQALDDFTTETRALAWGEAYFAWQQQPWIGLGTTNFQVLMENYGDFSTSHAHCTYLQILAETGLVGFTLFYIPILYLLWRSWKSRAVPIVLAGGCALLVWMAHGLVDVTFQSNPQCLLLLFTVIGLIIGGLNQCSNQANLATISEPGRFTQATRQAPWMAV